MNDITSISLTVGYGLLYLLFLFVMGYIYYIDASDDSIMDILKRYMSELYSLQHIMDPYSSLDVDIDVENDFRQVYNSMARFNKTRNTRGSVISYLDFPADYISDRKNASLRSGFFHR